MPKSIKYLALGTISFLLLWFLFRSSPSADPVLTTVVTARDLKVDIKTVGELEAARSTIIVSTIKGDLGKIIDLIPDGITVQPGDVLVKIDPTPFEEKIEKLRTSIKEQTNQIQMLEKTMAWEADQVEHENKTAHYEYEAAELELQKIIHGDGPQEIAKLKSHMQKAWLKYDDLNGYSNDLLELEAKGFLNAIELKQAQKRLEEEKDAYEMAKMQYESYGKHVYPMQLKKAETHVKRALINQEEVAKTGIYKIARSLAVLEQNRQSLMDLTYQLKEAEKELSQTEIKAPAPGMVVHREEYRAGQRRKPRVGDILVKNQPLIDLPDLTTMVVKTRVREVDLHKIEIGKLTTIEVDAYPHLVFKGHVTSIGILALPDHGRSSEEKYFEVRVLLDASDSHLRPGMTTRVVIHSDEGKNLPSLPIHAIFADDKKTYCYQKTEKGNYIKKVIQTGLSNEQWIEVAEGLEEGDCIALTHPFENEK